MSGDFFSTYLTQYVGDTEVPMFYHRWCAITGLGAYLGRQYYFNHGDNDIYTNMYCMLVGSPGTRKSSAIKLMKKLLIQAGYNTISAERSTKEKFLLDLAGEGSDQLMSPEELLDHNLFGGNDDASVSEIFVMADEFNDFFGNGNLEFISMLGNLWDFSGTYRNRVKNGKSVDIPNPTISILGGNTPVSLSSAFPPEVIGQGFFSRLIFVYGEKNGKQITFPKTRDRDVQEHTIQQLRAIRSNISGRAEFSGPSAELLADKIYKKYIPIRDARFEHYSTRRLTHILKIALIVSAAFGTKQISEEHLIYANTVLTFTEQFMPKALGEFGKSRNSDVTHKIMQILDQAPGVVTIKEIWESVHSDLEDFRNLLTLMQSLEIADKVQSLKEGFLPKKKGLIEYDSDTVDWSLLTDEERRMSI